MIAFEGHEEQIVENGDTIIFKNQTNSPLSVNTGIVFKNDGIYRAMVASTFIIIATGLCPVIRRLKSLFEQQF